MQQRAKILQDETKETDALLPERTEEKIQSIKDDADIQPGCNAANYMWLFAAPRKKSDADKQPEKEPSFWCFT